MPAYVRKIIYYSPRILSFLFAIFLGFFALDVFNENYGLLKTLIAFVIHLIPSFFVLFFSAIACYFPGYGFFLFFVLGFAYIFNFSGQPWLAYFIISGPLFLIGVLFLLNKIFYINKN